MSNVMGRRTKLGGVGSVAAKPTGNPSALAAPQGPRRITAAVPASACRHLRRRGSPTSPQHSAAMFAAAVRPRGGSGCAGSWRCAGGSSSGHGRCRTLSRAGPPGVDRAPAADRDPGRLGAPPGPGEIPPPAPRRAPPPRGRQLARPPTPRPTMPARLPRLAAPARRRARSPGVALRRTGRPDGPRSSCDWGWGCQRRLPLLRCHCHDGGLPPRLPPPGGPALPRRPAGHGAGSRPGPLARIVTRDCRPR